MNTMRAPLYQQVIRLFLGLMAGVTLAVSVMSSAAGLGQLAPGFEWLGWMLALLITAIQFSMNHTGRSNLTILVFGTISYIYGISTSAYWIFTRTDGTRFDVLIAFVAAVMIEAMPEPLLAMAFSGFSAAIDPFAELFGKRRRGGSPQVQQPRPLQGGHPHPQSVRDGRPKVVIDE